MKKMDKIITKNCFVIDPDVNFYENYKMLQKFKWELVGRLDDESADSFLEQMDFLIEEILRLIHDNYQFERKKNQLYLENLKLKGELGD